MVELALAEFVESDFVADVLPFFLSLDHGGADDVELEGIRVFHHGDGHSSVVWWDTMAARLTRCSTKHVAYFVEEYRRSAWDDED